MALRRTRIRQGNRAGRLLRAGGSVHLAVGLVLGTAVVVGCGGDDTIRLDGPAGSMSFPEADGPLPELTLATFDGTGEVALSRYRGSPLVLNFFASWCGPCRKELPDFEAVHQRIGDRVQIVGINTSETDPAEAASLLAETGVSFPVLVDRPGDLYAALEASVMPSTVFVDARGEVVDVHFGALDAAELTAAIDAAFGTG
jgi:thiol-disulfide isomerase/thioredoxin